MCNSREKTAIAKITVNKNIHIHYNKTNKLANYNNRNYIYCQEALEKASNSKVCKNMEIFFNRQRVAVASSRARHA